MARDEPKVNVRLPQELKDRLHALAAQNKRSVNAEIVAALEAWLEADLTANPSGSLAEIARSLEGLKILIERQEASRSKS